MQTGTEDTSKGNKYPPTGSPNGPSPRPRGRRPLHWAIALSLASLFVGVIALGADVSPAPNPGAGLGVVSFLLFMAAIVVGIVAAITWRTK